jgi:hypothetical protein
MTFSFAPLRDDQVDFKKKKKQSRFGPSLAGATARGSKLDFRLSRNNTAGFKHDIVDGTTNCQLVCQETGVCIVNKSQFAAK